MCQCSVILVYLLLMLLTQQCCKIVTLSMIICILKDTKQIVIHVHVFTAIDVCYYYFYYSIISITQPQHKYFAKIINDYYTNIFICTGFIYSSDSKEGKGKINNMAPKIVVFSLIKYGCEFRKINLCILEFFLSTNQAIIDNEFSDGI